MKTLLPILILLAGHSMAAAAPNQFVSVWTLNPEQDTPVWRVSLSPDVMETLHLGDGTDLMITDIDNQPVPFRRLRDDDLVETLVARQELISQSALIAEDARETSPLELQLHHDGTRLVVRSPGPDRDRQARGQLRFEALIGAPDSPSPDSSSDLPRQELVIELGSLHTLDLDCRLRDADDEKPASQRATLRALGDTRPRRYQARLPVESLPRAWHLGCYGQQAPDDLELVQATLESRGERDHRQTLTINPIPHFDSDPAILEFELDAPWRALGIDLTSTEPNVLSSVMIQSRAESSERWHVRAKVSLSTLENDQPARSRLADAEHLRHRHWRLLANPVLRQAPTIKLEVEVEDLAFFAQGNGPWRLYAGGLNPVAETATWQLVTDAASRLGPVWDWPRINPADGREAAGQGALETPAPEIPWQRYLLWLVLFFGAGTVAILAVRLLRQSG